MSDTTIKGLAALAGLGLVGVIAAGAVAGSHSAAADLQPKAERALAAAGLGRVDVDFEGREAELRGGSAVDLAKAEVIIEAIRGVRWAHVESDEPDEIELDARSSADAGAGPSLQISRSVVGTTISGVVPDADTAATLKALAAEAFGGTVTGDLEIDPGVSAADWLTGLPQAFDDLAGLKDLKVEIDGITGVLELDGEIDSRADADRIEHLVIAAVPGLDVTNHVEVDVGPSEPVKGTALSDVGVAAELTSS